MLRMPSFWAFARVVSLLAGAFGPQRHPPPVQKLSWAHLGQVSLRQLTFLTRAGAPNYSHEVLSRVVVCSGVSHEGVDVCVEGEWNWATSLTDDADARSWYCTEISFCVRFHWTLGVSTRSVCLVLCDWLEAFRAPKIFSLPLNRTLFFVFVNYEDFLKKKRDLLLPISVRELLKWPVKGIKKWKRMT